MSGVAVGRGVGITSGVNGVGRIDWRGIAGVRAAGEAGGVLGGTAAADGSGWLTALPNSEAGHEEDDRQEREDRAAEACTPRWGP